MQVLTDFYFSKAMPNGHCIEFFNESYSMRVLANKFLNAHGAGYSRHFCHKLFTPIRNEVGDLNEAMQKRNLFSPWGNFTCYPLKNVIVQV
jgi:hypothetical protein